MAFSYDPLYFCGNSCNFSSFISGFIYCGSLFFFMSLANGFIYCGSLFFFMSLVNGFIYWGSLFFFMSLAKGLSILFIFSKNKFLALLNFFLICFIYFHFDLSYFLSPSNLREACSSFYVYLTCCCFPQAYFLFKLLYSSVLLVVSYIFYIFVEVLKSKSISPHQVKWEK